METILIIESNNNKKTLHLKKDKSLMLQMENQKGKLLFKDIRLTWLNEELELNQLTKVIYINAGILDSISSIEFASEAKKEFLTKILEKTDDKTEFIPDKFYITNFLKS